MTQESINQLAKLQSLSDSDRKDREAEASTAVSGNVQAAVTGQDAQGVILLTQHGGQIVSEANGQNFSVGQVAQVSTSASGGLAKLDQRSTENAAPGSATQVGVIRFRLTPPVSGEDFASPGDLWVDGSPDPVGDIPQGILYVWVQELGAHIQIGGGTSSPLTLFGDGKPTDFIFGSTSAGDDYDAPVAGQVFINTNDDTNRPYLWTGTKWVSQQTKHYNFDEDGVPFAKNLEPGDFGTYTNSSGCKFLACRGLNDWENYDYTTEPTCSGGGQGGNDGPWTGDCRNNLSANICT